MRGDTILELKNVTKVFPGVVALDNVDFTLKEGEIHALMGENGAGKSTLIKIITGVHCQTKGKMFVNGEEVIFNSPMDAFAAGINVVHQERNLFPTFTVAENIMIEHYSNKLIGKVDQNVINKEAQKYIDLVGLDVPPTKNVEALSAGQKQLIEIAKALSSDAKIILLDEPTASISVNEANMLIKLIKKLRDEGLTFIFVSHKIEEIFEVADMVTVLRDGKNAVDTNTGEISTPIEKITRNELINRMVGRTEEFESLEIRDFSDAEVVLEAKGLRSTDSPKPKSFYLKKGELLGWYGLVGAGRTEFARTLIGYDPAIEGEQIINGEKVKITSIAQAQHKYKLTYLSENRKEEGLFLDHDVKVNLTSTIFDKIKGLFGFVKLKEEQEIAEKYKNELQVKTPSLKQHVRNLSGGNQQKVSLGKGLAVQPDILIIDEPTVGIDIKTKSEIHRLMHDLTKENKSVICITSDMAEMIQIADRILVFKDGEIVGELINTKSYDEMSKKIMSMIMN
ncbi:MAG TPA: sugar ABC transporter ATP-binding protein [Clostridiaceae bacterium]|nr:sugar ABC transporter ATP-binding protein [Clostridiaceae bacterium]